MCKGLGMDLCEIARMEKQLRDDRFLARFFTPGEIEYVRSRGAGAAATREALGKALGGGIDFELKEAEVCHTESGAPYFRLSGRLKERVGKGRLFLSISHDGGMAAAVCLLEGDLSE